MSQPPVSKVTSYQLYTRGLAKEEAVMRLDAYPLQTRVNAAQGYASATAAQVDATTALDLIPGRAAVDLSNVDGLTILDKLSVNKVGVDQLAANSVTTASLYVAYGANLWPNGSSEVAPPDGAAQHILDSVEFLGRASGDAYSGTHKRVLASPPGGGIGKMVLVIRASPGETYSFRAVGRMVSGSAAVRKVYTQVGWVTESGTAYNTSSTLVAPSGDYSLLEPYGIPAPPGTKEIRFELCAESSTSDVTTAYFDDIIVRNVSGQAGVISMYGGSGFPSGWLPCDGGAVSRSAFADLFAAIGTTYGAGDGSTSFNVPDLRSRMPIGAGTGSGNDARGEALWSRSLGEKNGSQQHALTSGEMPDHAHIDGFAGINSTASFGVASVGAVGNVNTQSGTSLSNHALTSGAGGGGAHNNMPPTLAISFIIKT